MAYFYSPFRKKYTEQKPGTCPFCDPKIIEKQTVRDLADTPIENKYYRWTINFFPKFEGHTMVVSKQHLTEFGKENKNEILAREKMMTLASTTLQKLYPNCGI